MNDRRSEKQHTFEHLSGFAAAEFPRSVLKRRLRIKCDGRALASDAGQVLMLTLARLTPRFCEHIDFQCPAASCIPRLQPLLGATEFSGATLARLAGGIWPEGRFTDGSRCAVEQTLIVGGGHGDLHVGIDRNGAAVVSREATPIQRPGAIFAALMAAGIASAQIAKLLYPELLKDSVEAHVSFGRGPFGGALDSASAPILARPVLAGVGAVGCALIYALIAVGAFGELLMVDRDVVKDSNLMRYVLFDEAHLERPKVDVAKELVLAAGIDLDVEKDQATFQQYLNANPGEHARLQLFISAVDGYDTRRELQSNLPRAIVNAGTGARDFTVSRHVFGDGYACLSCLYPPREQDVTRDAITARELDLDQDDVAELRRNKEPLTQAHLQRIARARGVAEDSFSAYVGEPLDTFYNKEVCAKLTVPTSEGDAVAPLAYGSALAGFLLAHAACFPAAGEYRHFRMDFMKGLRTPMRRNRAALSRCEHCGRDVMRRAYASQWC